LVLGSSIIFLLLRKKFLNEKLDMITKNSCPSLLQNVYLGSVWLLFYNRKNRDSRDNNIFGWKYIDRNIKINVSRKILEWDFIFSKWEIQMEHASKDNIFYFLSLKYPYKKTFNSKIIQLRHVKIKMVIIIVLKPNSMADLG